MRSPPRRHASPLGTGLVLTSLFAGCAAAPPAPTPAPSTLTLARALGSRQCEGGGVDPATLLAALRAAGIEPRGVGCGHDGRMRAQACGQPDGRLLIVQVDATAAKAAAALGWSALASGADPSLQPCPPAAPAATTR